MLEVRCVAQVDGCLEYKTYPYSFEDTELKQIYKDACSSCEELYGKDGFKMRKLEIYKVKYDLLKTIDATQFECLEEKLDGKE